MPKKKPAPKNDPEFDAEVEELLALAREIEQAEDVLGEIITDRDVKIVEVLERWEVSQAALGRRIGMGQQNLARIVNKVRSGKPAASSGPKGRPVRKGATSRAARRRKA